MNKIYFVILFHSFIIFLNANNINFTKQEQVYINTNTNTIKVAMISDFPPFSIYKNNKLSGFSYELLEKISKKSGLKFKYIVDTWPNNLKKFRQNKVDIIDAITFTKKRKSFTNFSKPYYGIPLVIYTKKIHEEQYLQKDIQDLNLFKITKNSNFAEKMRSLGSGGDIIVFGQIQNNKHAIKILNRLNTKNINKTDLRFGVSKENIILHAIIQKTFENISNEELNILNKKWLYNGTNENLLNLSKEESKYLLEKNSIKICTNHDLIPIEFINKDNNPEGMSMDILKIIEDQFNIRFEHIQTISNRQSITFFKDKKCDIISGIENRDLYLGFTHFTSAYLNYKLAIITQKDNSLVTNLEDMNDKIMSIKVNSKLTKKLKLDYPNIKTLKTTTTLDAFKSVNNKTANYTVAPLPIASYYLSTYAMTDLYIAGYTDITYTISMAVRNDDEVLLNILNKALNKISPNQFREVHKKWTSFAQKEKIDYTLFWELTIITIIILSILLYRQLLLNKHYNELKKANKEIEKKTFELVKEKEIFKTIFTKSTDGVLIYKNNKIIDCNESSLQLLGYESKKELLNTYIKYFYPKYQPNGRNSYIVICEKITETLKNGTVSFEWYYTKKNGNNSWADIVLTSITIENEPVIHILFRDINERKKTEEMLVILTNNLEQRVSEEVENNKLKTKQLIQQSRLAQMGELISMISHQWRQPLTAISTTANNLLIHILLDEKLDKKVFENEVTLITKYSKHLSTTINDFRNFYKIDNIKKTSTIEKITETSLNIIRHSLEEKNIKLTINFNCFKELSTYTTEVNQVVLNLLKNAEDILISRNTIRPQININTYCTKDMISLEIQDNAGGIKEEDLAKLYDPYFTTKSAKEGSGLGLYMSKIIIEDHCEGTLKAQNYHNGALFTISIPDK